MLPQGFKIEEDTVPEGFVLDAGPATKTLKLTPSAPPPTKATFFQDVVVKSAKDLGKQLVGAGETALSFGTGAALYLPSKAYGALALPFGEEATRGAEEAISSLAYEPRTEAGRAGAGKLGELFHLGMTPARFVGESTRGAVSDLTLPAPETEATITTESPETVSPGPGVGAAAAYLSELFAELLTFKAAHVAGKEVAKGKKAEFQRKFEKLSLEEKQAIMDKDFELDKTFAREGPVLDSEALVPSEAIRLPHEPVLRDPEVVSPELQRQIEGKMEVEGQKALPPGQGFELTEGVPRGFELEPLQKPTARIQEVPKVREGQKLLPPAQGFELVDIPKGVDKPAETAYDILKEEGRLDIARENYEGYLNYRKGLPAPGKLLPFKEWLESKRILSPEEAREGATLSTKELRDGITFPETTLRQKGRLPDDTRITTPKKPELEPLPLEAKAAEKKPAKPKAKEPWEMERREATTTTGNLFHSRLKGLLDIDNSPVASTTQKKVASKLFDAIDKGDIKHVEKIEKQYFHRAFVKGISGGAGPVQVKQPSAIDVTIGKQARLGRELLESHKKSVEQAISEGKIESHPDYPELTKPKEPAPKVEKPAEEIEAVRKLEPAGKVYPPEAKDLKPKVDDPYKSLAQKLANQFDIKYLGQEEAVVVKAGEKPKLLWSLKNDNRIFKTKGLNITELRMKSDQFKELVKPAKFKKIAARTPIDIAKDVNALLGERGQLGEAELTLEQKLARSRLKKDIEIIRNAAANVGKSVSEYLTDLGYDKKIIPYLARQAEELKAPAKEFVKAEKADIKAEVRAEAAVKETVKTLRDEYLQPVKGNKLDEGAIAYLKEGDFDAYLENMPRLGNIRPGEVFKLDPDSKKLIATIPGKKGKAAIRESGYHVVKSFLDAFKKPKDLTEKQALSWVKDRDLSKRDAAWTDPTRFIQKIDQGKFNGPAQQHILHPARSTTLAKLQWADQQKMKIAAIQEKYNIRGRKEAEAIGDVLESIPFEESLDTAAKLLENPDIQKVVSKFKPEKQRQIVEAARDFREFFDLLVNDQNSARINRKQKTIKYRGSYRPHVMKANLWSKLFGLKRKPEHLMSSPEMPDFIFPNQPFNARALAREGGLKGYELERNITKLASDYVETASKDIFDTNIVHQNKIHAATLRGLGLENAADAVDVWTAESFAGVSPRLTRWAKGAFPEPMHKGALKLRRNLTRAVFPLNWTWNMFIQTSSAGITYARYGNRASIAGMRYFTDPEFKKAVRENAYSSIIKNRWGGSATYQDLSSSLLKMKKLDATKMEKVEHYANFLTRAVEDALTGHAVGAAYYKGKKLGLKDRALWEYASEGGAKTQSMYNLQDLPGLLRAREVGVVGPFQTFAFEVFNTVREMDLPGIRKITGKTGTYETIAANSAEGKALISNRLKMLGRWSAAILVTNAVVDKAINRKPWEISSFIPFYSFISGKYGQGMPMPARFVQEFRKGVRNVVAYGSWKKLRNWVIKYQILGGVQINRTLEGIEAAAQGGVKDVRGKTVVPIKGDVEKLRAITMGPFRTKAGAEYIDKIRERQSLFYKPKKKSSGKIKGLPSLKLGKIKGL